MGAMRLERGFRRIVALLTFCVLVTGLFFTAVNGITQTWLVRTYEKSEALLANLGCTPMSTVIVGGSVLFDFTGRASMGTTETQISPNTWRIRVPWPGDSKGWADDYIIRAQRALTEEELRSLREFLGGENWKSTHGRWERDTDYKGRPRFWLQRYSYPIGWQATEEQDDKWRPMTVADLKRVNPGMSNAEALTVVTAISKGPILKAEVVDCQAERARNREPMNHRVSVAFAQWWQSSGPVSQMWAILVPVEGAPWWLQTITITVLASAIPWGAFYVMRWLIRGFSSGTDN